MSDKHIDIKEYIDLKNTTNMDYSMGVLLSLKLLIANLTLTENMNTQAYIEALRTSIDELTKANVNPAIVTAPQNILTDLEELVDKISRLKKGEKIDE